MAISVGDKLPQTTFIQPTADGPAGISSDELFSGKKVVLFAVPGAFTPTCHVNHLPGFVEHAGAIKAKGVDTIAVTSVNDPFVMGAWAEASQAGDAVMFLADGNGDFAKAIDMTLDGSGFGLGMRSLRYAMIVDDGTVSWLGVEENPGEAKSSAADAVLAAL
ncbi:MAG: peroxiredoxin [Pseudomonadota bacterium]